MALAKAQFDVVELASLLEERGACVNYAIHPVAGRMPGHMNVLLAEADVDYDNLLEMDEVNPRFADTDVALVFGACDVVNPAAIQSEGTPISGMPILMAHEAQKVIICNFDKKPGYSGVDEPTLRQRQGHHDARGCKSIGKDSDFVSATGGWLTGQFITSRLRQWKWTCIKRAHHPCNTGLIPNTFMIPSVTFCPFWSLLKRGSYRTCGPKQNLVFIHGFRGYQIRRKWIR
jgi:hypothetical protein